MAETLLCIDQLNIGRIYVAALYLYSYLVTNILIGFSSHRCACLFCGVLYSYKNSAQLCILTLLAVMIQKIFNDT